MTYSILGFDPSSGDLGVAVQSKFPGVGGLVPYGEADVGAVATQAFANPRHASVGLTLLKNGATPRQAMEILLGSDAQAHRRQFALVDSSGRTASHTGQDLDQWAGWSGSASAKNCVAIGNGLAGRQVLTDMTDTFQYRPERSLAERLMTALMAGETAGGDIRGQQSAALLVLRRNGGYGAMDDRHVVISVYDHPQPIAELQRCFELHRLSYFPSDPANLVTIGPRIAVELKNLMARKGFYSGDFDERWDDNTRRRLVLFLGSENYDNRINNGDLLDLEVLADLRRRYGETPR